MELNAAASFETQLLAFTPAVGYYSNNLDCIWQIRTQAGGTVSARLAWMDVEAGNPCPDWLRAYDGLAVSEAQFATLPVLRTWCGVQTTPDSNALAVESTGAVLTLRFKTNAAGIGAGFRVLYSTGMLHIG